MKKVLIVLISLFSMNSFAKDFEHNLQQGLDRAQDMYQSLLGTETEFYYLFWDNFSGDETTATQNCRIANNFVATSSAEVARYYIQYGEEMIASIYQQEYMTEQERVLAAKNLAEAASDLKASLAGASLQMCGEYSVPAYSDGLEMRFIKVNGQLRFGFGYGRPD